MAGGEHVVGSRAMSDVKNPGTILLSAAVLACGVAWWMHKANETQQSSPTPTLLIGIRRDAVAFALGATPGLNFDPTNADRDVATSIERVTLAERSGACTVETAGVNGDLASLTFRMPEGLSEADPAYAGSIACLMTFADVAKIPSWSTNLRRMDADFTVEGEGRRYRFLRGPTGRGIIVTSGSQP